MRALWFGAIFFCWKLLQHRLTRLSLSFLNYTVKLIWCQKNWAQQGQNWILWFKRGKLLNCHFLLISFLFSLSISLLFCYMQMTKIFSVLFSIHHSLRISSHKSTIVNSTIFNAWYWEIKNSSLLVNWSWKGHFRLLYQTHYEGNLAPLNEY